MSEKSKNLLILGFVALALVGVAFVAVLKSPTLGLDLRGGLEVTLQAFEMLEVDRLGLEPLDRRLLQTLIVNFRGGPVGLDTIATSLAEEPETIEDVHEPFLIQNGLLARTPRGRVATELAYTHLGLTPPPQPPQQQPLL